MATKFEVYGNTVQGNTANITIVKTTAEEEKMETVRKDMKQDRSAYQILFTPQGFEPDFPASPDTVPHI